MLKYFDNIIFWLQHSGGGSVYWGELMKRFSAHGGAVFIEPSKKTTGNIVRKDLLFDKILHETPIPLPALRYMPLQHRLESGAVFHSSYYRYSALKGINNFVTVHDFVYERFSRGIKKYIHHKQKCTAVENSKGVVCISENTKKDLLHFIPSAKSKKIKVIYNGVSDDFYKVAGNKIKGYKNAGLFEKKKMILYIGHRNAYKNFLFAVETVAVLHDGYALLIVGNALNKNEKILLDKKLNGRYHFMGNVNNAELNFIYNLCYCLLYPSQYEGFGIPIAEAMKCGCTVVALNSSSIPEVAGSAALLCNELAVEKFKQQILSLDNYALRKSLVEGGFEQSKKFSWDKCFNELNDFYESLK